MGALVVRGREWGEGHGGGLLPLVGARRRLVRVRARVRVRVRARVVNPNDLTLSLC